VRALESDTFTGTRTINATDVAKRVAAMLSISEDDSVDFKDAVKTATNYTDTDGTFNLRVGASGRGEVELSVALPADSFNDGEPCFAPLGVLALASN
jgi:hypothetical protein